MAKLYAELSSDKGGRVVGKGGNETINVGLQLNNKVIGMLETRRHNDGTTYVRYWKRGKCKVIDIVNEYQA